MEAKSSYEIEMARKNNSVVFFHNIDNQDFEHTYDGVPFLIKVGETLPLQYPVGVLLAKHLAMKILKSGKMKNVGKNDVKVTNLYTVPELNALIERIIVREIERPLDPIMSRGDIEKRKAEALKEEFKDELPSKPEIDKKDIVKILKERGVKFDARASKEDLLVLIAESEKYAE